MVTTKSKVKSKSQSNTKAPSRTKVKSKAAPDNQVNNQANKQAGILGGSGDHRMIALNKLNISPKNVRRIKASETDDAELLASIRQQGVKQNLVVHPGPKGMFLVDAGGRRLKALQTLAQEGAIPQDHAVACLIEDETEATLTSLTENSQRAAMHPADQFMAFSVMIEEGRSEDEIALKFGVTVDLVRRRLKLARVAPQILEAFREDEITLEVMMAFTISDHHDRQMTVWNSIKDSYCVHPTSIRRLLTQTSYSANSRLGVFVGQAAYEEAGGAIMSDLFSDRDTTYFEDPELVERLALERLDREAEVYRDKWSWVDVHLELESGALRSFGHFNRQEVDPDPTLLKEIETLRAREEGHCQVVLALEDGYFCFMLNIEDPSSLKGFRFPRDVVSYTVWAYHRFALSLRDVEDLLAARGIIVSYETVRDWVNRFGHQFAAKIRRDRPPPSDKWHLDEVVIKIKGKTHWLWRAVDGNGDVLDILLQSRRNKAAAKRFLKKLLKRWGQPRVLISDKLGSYGAAKSEVAPGLEHRQHKGLNNRSEASHRHTRRREKIMGRFKSPRQAQRFLSVHDQTCAIFRPKRHLLSAKSYRHARSDAFDLWAGYATELTA